MLKILPFVFAIMAYLACGVDRIFAQPSEKERWQEDLRYMASEMPKWHKNLFHSMRPDQFESAVRKLNDRIPEMARHEIIVEMARITAMVGDGHTNIAPTRDPKIGFHALPVKFYLFQDGLFIRAATSGNADLVGARVLSLGNIAAEEAISRAGEIIGHDNEMGIKFFAPHLLSMPEVLHALKITEDAEKVPLLLRSRAGKEQAIILQPAGPAEMLPPDTDTTWLNQEGWIDLRDETKPPTPLWLKNLSQKFWFEYLPESKIVYVQLNQVADKENETLADFSKRLFAFVNTNQVEKLIFDLRLNRGGNGTLLRPLLLETIKSRINKPGKLFAIIGRSTWSAAQFLLNDFEKYTDAIFVGEPSASKGNHYGDSRRITLPNSGITVRVSIYFWQDWSPWDERLWTAPDITAEMSSEDYRSNIDPAMRAILSYVPKKSLQEVLEDAVASGDAEHAVKQFRDFKADPANKYADTEVPLLIAGSRLLRENEPEQAVVMFKLNAEEHPHSALSHYAVGEAYRQVGNKEEAVKHFEKALQLNPKYYDAAQKLKTIRN